MTNGFKNCIITSMNKKYYEASGKAMMASWKRHGNAIGSSMFIMNNYLN